MTTANISQDEKQKALEQLFCRAITAPGFHGQLIFLSVLNSVLSVTAFLENSLILVALRKESSLHPPSKLLLRSLTTTDLCVGLISQPLYVTELLTVVNEHWNICRSVSAALFISGITLSGLSLAIMTALSVDRLLALLLGLRYRQVVTLKRTYTAVITCGVMSAVFSTTYFWNSLIILWTIGIVISLCLVTSVFAYTKIFLTLRRLQTQVQDLTKQPNQTSPLNIARYREAVSSAILLQVTMVACYLPRGIVAALSTNNELFLSVFLARGYTATLVFLNSSLNPILYCWKIKEVRQAVKETIRQIVCCSSR